MVKGVFNVLSYISACLIVEWTKMVKCPKGHEVWLIPEQVGTGYVCEIYDMVYQESELVKNITL